MKPDTDPLAGTNCRIWDHDGQQGVDGSNGSPPVPVKRKPGRPRCADEPLGSVTVHLPTPAQDRIISLAKSRRQTVSEYLRDVMIQLFLRH